MFSAEQIVYTLAYNSLDLQYDLIFLQILFQYQAIEISSRQHQENNLVTSVNYVTVYCICILSF